jgi:hypothetical protein
MSRIKNLLGKRFGRLIAVKFIGVDEKRTALWLCQCDCGNQVTVTSSRLGFGMTKSCGCYKSDLTIKRNTVHGKSHHPLYKKWQDMKSRCYNKNNKRYYNYGGRGISICEKWHDFENFYNWAMKHGYKKGLTIERKDVDGNYCPNNCTFIPFADQIKTRKYNRYVTIDGVTKTVADWSRETGINYMTLITRITESGYTGKDIIKPKEEKRDLKNAKIEIGGQIKTLYEWSEFCGINYKTICSRYSKGEKGKSLIRKVQERK